jgi:hypothetical protein
MLIPRPRQQAERKCKTKYFSLTVLLKIAEKEKIKSDFHGKSGARDAQHKR